MWMLTGVNARRENRQLSGEVGRLERPKQNVLHLGQEAELELRNDVKETSRRLNDTKLSSYSDQRIQNER